MIKRNDIIAVIFVAALGILSVYYAYGYVGVRAGRMALAACGIIAYLIIRDFRGRFKKAKEEEEKRSGGREVISISKSRKNRMDIGNIAHKSTKDKNLNVNKDHNIHNSQAAGKVPAGPDQQNVQSDAHDAHEDKSQGDAK